MLKQAVCLGIALVIIMTCSVATAGDYGKNRHDMEVLFDVRGLDHIGLNSFDGGLGFRYYFLDGFTIRPNFSYYNDSSSRDYSSAIIEEKEREGYSFDLVVEKHFSIRDRFAPYLGLGYSLGNGTDDRTLIWESDPEIGQKTSQKYTDDFHSVLGILGVQWQAHRLISLGCEYRIEWKKVKTASHEVYFEEKPRLSNSSGNSLGTSTSSLYIAICF